VQLVDIATWGRLVGPRVVWIWDAETGAVLQKREVGVKPLDSMVWSADGSTIVVSSWDGLVHVLDREANKCVK
jgi:WD40 repeat protein